MAATPDLPRVIGNKISTTLSSSIDSSTTTIPFTSGSGMNANGGYIIVDKGLSTEEIIYIESVTGNTGTVSSDGRGRCGTSAVAHGSGATVYDVLVDEHIEGLIVYAGGAILESVYPVGSIYINASVSTNPGTLLGFGTWTAFGAGRVLVGLDGTQTEFDTAEETGGTKTHTLTSNEMPTHTHTQNAHGHSVTDPGHTHTHSGSSNGAFGSNGSFVTTGGGGFTTGSSTTGISIANATATNQNTGGGAAHNNLQPYIVVYMWKRTA